MALRVGLTKAAVIQAATELADAVGLDALSLGMLADRLGVRTPTLYHYVPGGVSGLQRELALQSLHDQADQLGKAVMGKAGVEALVAAAGTYRAYIKAHPGLYNATMRAMTPDDPEMQKAQSAIVAVVLQALDAFHLSPDDAIHIIRMARIIAHGTATLELGGGFGLPQDVDETYRRLIDLFVKHLQS